MPTPRPDRPQRGGIARLIALFLLLLARALPAPATLLWTEGFEGPYPPAGWIESGTAQVSTYAMEGAFSVRLTAAGHYLITPPVSGTSLIFWTYTTAADPLIVVETAPDLDGPWTEAVGSPFSGYTGQWNGRFIDLSDLGEVRVRFRKSGTGTLYLDEISLETTDSPINRPPVFAPTGSRSAITGHALSFSVSATDPDGDPLLLQAIDLPPGALFDSVSGEGEVTGLFRWDPAGTPGVYTSVFSVADGTLSISMPVVITVHNVPPAEDDWNVIYNLPQQSSSGTLYPAQFRIRDAFVARLDALRAGDRAVLATFTFSANEGAGAILNAIGNALDRGAQVAFIADGGISLATVYGGQHSLFSLATRLDNPLTLSVDTSLSGIMHHKFGLFDYGGGYQWVLSASWNFTLAASANQWNIALEARNPSLFALFLDEADEMLAGRFQGAKSNHHDNRTFSLPGSHADSLVRFAPYPDATPGGNNAERDLVERINQAQHSILFALNKLNRFAIRDALIAAADRGVRIRGVIPASDTAPDGVSAELVAHLNDPSRYATTNRVEFLVPAATADYSAFDSGQSDLVHTKYMVIDHDGDHPVAIHGSPNWSFSALVSSTANDENLLILPHRDIARAFADHFHRVTATGPFAEGNSLLVRWDFNDGLTTASDGIPANRDRTVRRVPDPPALTFPGGALSANGWEHGAGTKYWETSFSSLNHRDLHLCSVQFSTLTGPSAFQLQYKTAADEPYRDVPGGAIRADIGRGGQLIRLPLPPECNDREEVFFRWLMTCNVAVNGNAVSAAGASRIDDIIIRGNTYNQPPRIDPVGDRAVFAGQPLIFPVTASDPIDGDPVLLTASGLPPGAEFEKGTFRWNTAAPEGAWLVTFTATDKDGSTSETITITVHAPPALLISEVADPAGTGANVYRFVELYNAGDEPIDLAAEGWVLSRQVNGGSTWQDVALTGRVDAAGTYLVAKGRDDFIQAYGVEPHQESSRIDGNGDDAYFLFRGGNRETGLLVDIYGEIDTDGTGTPWDYTRSRAVRNDDVLRPSAVWIANQWTIYPGAGIDAMTPGEHGPRPMFSPVNDPFVFSGEHLEILIMAENPIRPDEITLAATSLPDGARFEPLSSGGTATGKVLWDNPPDGVWSIELSASGQTGTAFLPLTVTVAPWSRLKGYFHGWIGNSLIELENGQIWQQTDGSLSSVSPPLFRPRASVSRPFGSPRLTIEGVHGFVTAELREVRLSGLSGPFSGLRFENRYTLNDESVWEQISFEHIPSSTNPVRIQMWMQDNLARMRFLDRYDAVIGTCTVRATTPETDGPVHTFIDGWFRGWSPRRVFALANGDLWQQTSSERAEATLYRPAVTLSDPLQTGRWRMAIEGAGAPASTVEVHRLHDGVATSIDGLFSGFAPGRVLKLADGTWWRQSCGSTSTSIRRSPPVLIWRDGPLYFMELPDEGLRITSEPISPLLECRITPPFSGLRFGNLYVTDEGSSFLQLCFTRKDFAAEHPEAMLWIDEGHVRLVVRASDTDWIGSCIVADPLDDSDGNGIPNLDEVIAGSDPLDPDSVFTLAASHSVLQWDSVADRIYTVEWTPCLSEPFRIVEDNLPAPQNHWPTCGHPPPPGFYRLRVRLADD